MSDSARSAALKRLEQLKHFWTNFVHTLTEMVEKRDHETLGYSTFTEMWAAHMSELPLSNKFLVHAVYTMLAEGSAVDSIADAVLNATPETVETIKRQRDNGLAPDQISVVRRRPAKSDDATIVREHERKLPGAADTMHITLGQLSLQRHLRMAKKFQMSSEEYGRAALENFYELLKDAEPGSPPRSRAV